MDGDMHGDSHGDKHGHTQGDAFDALVRQRLDEGIDIKSIMLQSAAEQRGLPVTRLSPRVTMVDAGQAEPLVFVNMNGPSSSPGGKYLCDAKDRSRSLLAEAGLSVTPSRLFPADAEDAAWEYARQLPGPVVVKPNSLSRGRGVSTDLSTEDGFRAAWDRAARAHPNRRRTPDLLVEQQATGNDYRFFVVLREEPVIFATLRRRSSVVGDGERSVGRLLQRKNRRRARNPYLGDYPIPMDPAALDMLTAAGLGLDHVPAPKERVYLRSVSNLSAGGDSVDHTDRYHPGFRDVVLRALRAVPGMRYAGVDIIAPSIRTAPTPENHVISEVEYSPAPITHFPWHGPRRDMAAAVLEYYLHG